MQRAWGWAQLGSQIVRTRLLLAGEHGRLALLPRAGRVQSIVEWRLELLRIWLKRLTAFKKLTWDRVLAHGVRFAEIRCPVAVICAWIPTTLAGNRLGQGVLERRIHCFFASWHVDLLNYHQNSIITRIYLLPDIVRENDAAVG